jgi:DNA-binding MarR family transcriptional regulator
LFLEGFLVVPYKFLRSYAALRPPLTHGEVLFILHLMTFKWEEDAPYPSYQTLARLMGVDQKTVQRYAQALCRKKYLYRIFSPKGQRGPNRFDLTKLFEALSRAESIPVRRPRGAEEDRSVMPEEFEGGDMPVTPPQQVRS